MLSTNAKWLWTAEHDPNTWLAFRKRLRYASGVHTVSIAAETRYWLYVNGELVIRDGGLNRGPNPSDGYYDEADIALRDGDNTIAILVWYWGNEGRNNVDCGQGGLLFDGLGIISDDSWKVKKHPAYLPDRPPLSSYLHGGHNVIFDASADIAGWETPEYDDGEWENATVMGGYPCAPYNSLHKRPIPFWKDYGLAEYSGIERRGKTIIASLPHAAMVSPYMRVRSEYAGAVIDVRTDRYVVNGGGPDDEHNSYNGYRAEFITASGENEYEIPTALYGEQVIYALPEGVEAVGLKYRETGFACSFAGSFRCDDEFLNRLYEKCARTLYVCMRDNYMDCPDRECGQWIGDVSAQVPQTFYALSRESDMLTRKCMDDLLNWMDGDVMLLLTPGINRFEVPAQSLNAIGKIGIFAEYYLHTGDYEYIKKLEPAALRYLKLFAMDAEGLVSMEGRGWGWCDHGANVDARIISNAWYYMALAMWEDDELKSRAESIRANFDRLFWTERGYSSGVFFDERANALAVLAGLASEDKYPVIREVLTTVQNATPYMEGYVLEALFRMSCHADAMKRLRERYEPLVENENSTLWEDFKILGTKNHAWSGSPLTLMVKWLAGIYPLKPGYVEYSATPNLCGLKWIEAAVPSVAGNITVSAK